jgi:hypothetical protein
MLTSPLRMNGATYVQRRASGSGSRIALIAVMALFCEVGARADIINITITNATFEATCVGGSGTCTEVINGSFDYNTATGAGSISMTLAGTLAGTFALGPVACTGSLCFGSSNQIYIPPAVGQNPIEFSPSIQPCPPPGFTAPPGGGNLCGGDPDLETGFIVPVNCGGNQPNCGAIGSFPGGANYALFSGSYTAVDLTTTPEPNFRMLTGIGLLLVVMLKRFSPGLPQSS